jgi:hypothetical protein
VSDNMLKCEYFKACTNPVTHIGSKGHIYCTPCAFSRRGGNSGERCRRMRNWELRELEAGRPLQSYRPVSREINAAMAVANNAPRIGVGGAS